MMPRKGEKESERAVLVFLFRSVYIFVAPTSRAAVLWPPVFGCSVSFVSICVL